MGTEKALLPVQGRPMIQIVAETLSHVFTDVIVAGGRVGQFEHLRLPVIPDLFTGSGPMAGIHAALSYSRPRPVFVLSCDTPLIPIALIQHIVEFESHSPSKIAQYDNEVQPLCGLYSTACLPLFRRHLEEGKFSVVKSLDTIDFEAVPISPDQAFFNPNMFRNINRPEDYQSILTLGSGNPNG
jgi:molybdopterin-guanine dinucleotide biosynthesis protein A